VEADLELETAAEAPSAGAHLADVFFEACDFHLSKV
jgi:hypothetical protein